MPHQTLEELSTAFAAVFGRGIEEKAPRRLWTEIGAARNQEALAWLKKAGFLHLATITGVDLGDRFELIYHLVKAGSVLSVKCTIPRENPDLPSVTGVMPAAILYEQELHDILGIRISGHPDLKPLILPEGWPEGVYPLRKDWVVPDGGGKCG